MAKKQGNYYFQAFEKLVTFSLQEAKLLNEIIEHYDHTRLDQLIKDMHQIEHTADLEKHALLERLVKEFITPIEREDIIAIAQKIDDVTDAIEDVLMKLYMYNVTELKPELKDFTSVISECCVGMEEAVKEFHNFKRSVSLKQSIIEVNRLEEVCDAIYINAVHKLFVESKDPIHLMIWSDIFLSLEKCCDLCEDVADAIESVVMKNS